MKKVFKNLFMVMIAMVTSLGFVACSNDDDNQATVNLEGKWLTMSDTYKELLIINADHTLLSTGADETSVWNGVKGKIELNGDHFSYISEDGDNSEGTYSVKDNKLTLSSGGEVLVYNKLLEDFSLNGSWKCSNVQSYIKAVKDELHLPFGSIVNGEEIPTVVKTANIEALFIKEAINAYFRNVTFNSNGEMSYKVIKEGVETPMTKNYVLTENMMKITGKVGSINIENQFLVFQSSDHQQSFLFLTKENIADMFVGYALMLREGNVSEGSTESLEAFKKEFMEVFENYAVIIYLQKQ